MFGLISGWTCFLKSFLALKCYDSNSGFYFSLLTVKNDSIRYFLSVITLAGVHSLLFVAQIDV